jgi:hypothetical protein
MIDFCLDKSQALACFKNIFLLSKKAWAFMPNHNKSRDKSLANTDKRNVS